MMTARNSRTRTTTRKTTEEEDVVATEEGNTDDPLQHNSQNQGSRRESAFSPRHSL